MVIIYGIGGEGGSGIPYNSHESPYLRKRFFYVSLFFPKDSENINGLKFFRPRPKDASEIFRPPFATRPKISPPFKFDLKIEMTPKPIKTPENIEFQGLKEIGQV